MQSRWFPWIALAYSARAAVFVSRTLAVAQAMRVIEPSRWGLASGALETVAWGGAIVAPLIGGWLYEIQPSWPFQLSLALLPVTMILTYFLAPRRPRLPAPAAPRTTLELQAGAEGET